MDIVEHSKQGESVMDIVEHSKQGESVVDYDRSTYNNPDAQVWAKFFIETTKDMGREVFSNECYMTPWFSSAMMAMHDSTIARYVKACSDLSQQHIAECIRVEKAVDEIERLRKILSTVLEACEDVNSPDRKVRKEITKTVRKALKGACDD